MSDGQKSLKCPGCGYEYVRPDWNGAGTRVLARTLLVKCLAGSLEVVGRCPKCRQSVSVPPALFGRVRYVVRRREAQAPPG